jgi:hypothetical protein
MNTKANTLSLGRITITFAATESQPRSLEAIARLAASFSSEVSGVFIEDLEMLRAARLPFALEVCRATNRVKPADLVEIERSLKQKAVTARQLIADTAEQSGIKWNFKVVRQRTASAVLELAQGTDVIVFSSATSKQHRQRVRKEELFHSVHHELNGDSIVALLDNSEAGGKALEFAHKLAEFRHIPLSAVVIDAQQVGLDKLVHQLQRESGERIAHLQVLCNPRFSEIVTTASAFHPVALVLPTTLIDGSTERIRKFEELIDCPILIVN